MSKRLLMNVFLCTITVVAGIFLYSKNQFFPEKEMESFGVMLQPLTVHPKEEPKKLIATKKIEEKTTSTLSLLAVGDIMLDRSVMLKTQAAKDYNHPFLRIDDVFEEYDLHLANLEGPITTNKSVSNGTGGARFTFTFSPNFVEPLKNRFQFLSLANNHENNFGQKGIDQTRKYLGDAGVHFFGDPNNVTEFVSVTSTYNGITLGFVGYHQLVETGFENVIAQVKRLRPLVDVVIVMPHWGIEYKTESPSPRQVEDAHALVDAGADSIIGAHPHVVQPIEVYKDKVIFYSLGNFIFDQYFSEETQTGLAVGLQIEKNNTIKIKYTLIPLDINSVSQPSVAKSPKKEKLLEHLSRFSKGVTIVDGKLDLGVTAPQGFHYQLQDASYNTLKSLQKKYLVVDPDDSKLQTSEIQSLQKNGNKVLAYLSIGEAENYRDYWQKSWRVGSPAFLDEENPDWEGNFKVKYWDKQWKQIIFDRVKKIQEAGYDGVYLDIIDAYEYYQEKGKKDADQEMTLLVHEISLQAKQNNIHFLIVPQNAPELYVSYKNVIDGLGAEDVFYNDDEPQDAADIRHKLTYLRQAIFDKKFVLSVDYAINEKNICDYYKKCQEQNFFCMVSNRDLKLNKGILCGKAL